MNAADRVIGVLAGAAQLSAASVQACADVLRDEGMFPSEDSRVEADDVVNLLLAILSGEYPNPTSVAEAVHGYAALPFECAISQRFENGILDTKTTGREVEPFGIVLAGEIAAWPAGANGQKRSGRILVGRDGEHRFGEIGTQLRRGCNGVYRFAEIGEPVRRGEVESYGTYIFHAPGFVQGPMRRSTSVTFAVLADLAAAFGGCTSNAADESHVQPLVVH